LAEDRDGDLIYAGQVRFGFAGKGLWHALAAMRASPRWRGGFIPVQPGLLAEVKYSAGSKSAISGTACSCRSWLRSGQAALPELAPAAGAD